MSRMGPRKNLVGLGVVAMVMTGTVVGALQDQLTEEEYGPTMSEVRLLVGDAELHIDSFYWPELGEDLDKMFPMFRQMEVLGRPRERRCGRADPGLTGRPQRDG